MVVMILEKVPSQFTGGSESLDDRTEGRDIPWQHDREDS